MGRDGHEVVEPQTLCEYQRRANVILEYRWPCSLDQLRPTDIIKFRTWLLENKTRDLARRTMSSFHPIVIEMIHQGYLFNDPAAGITIKNNGRYEEHEVCILTDLEMAGFYRAIDALAHSKHIQAHEAWQKYRPMFYLAGFSGMRPSE